MTSIVVKYYDTYDNAVAGDLTPFTDVFTLGRSARNDGGGAHYKQYDNPLGHPLSFQTAIPGTDPVQYVYWGLVPDGDTVNPLQAGAVGDGSTNDRGALQDCIEFIEWWRTTPGVDQGRKTSKTAVTLVIPGNHTFVVDATVATPQSLDLAGPITIEGEDRFTSVIRLLEDSVEPESPGTPVVVTHLFNLKRQSDVTFRSFTARGSYGPDVGDQELLTHGLASLIDFSGFGNGVENVLLEDMVFTRNRAVIISGDGSRDFTMRGCILSESRRGGLIITDAVDTVVEDNEFRWISDDPVAITIGASPLDDPDAVADEAGYIATGGPVIIARNRCFGCRGLNVVGAKNVLIVDNTHVLGRGRAIHVGCGSDQDKGDTSTLNVIVRNNVITDLLDAKVDPDQDQNTGAHRAIDIEMLQTAPSPVGTPGLPDATGAIADPATYYYQRGQGLQGGSVWKKNTYYDNGELVWWSGRLYESADPDHTKSGTMAPTLDGDVSDGGVNWHYLRRTVTPHSGNIAIEGNIISRSRTSVAAFADYGVGEFGGFARTYDDPNEHVGVTPDEIQPDEGIAVAGSVRNLVIRGNQIRNCAVEILLDGRNLALPFSLLDVRIEGNDLSDWSDAGVRFKDYDLSQPQRVSIVHNRVDGDPFYASLNRNGGGTWKNVSTGAFIDTNGVTGLLVAGNHVRNVPQLISRLVDANPTMQDNIAYCNLPALGSIGYNAGNVGIGNLIAPQLGWRYVIEDGAPASSTFGKVLNPSPLASAAVPSSGAWVEGTFVKKLVPSAGTITVGGVTLNYELSGWRRTTTGQSNVTADWREQRVLTP